MKMLLQVVLGSSLTYLVSGCWENPLVVKAGGFSL
jgi:hypothetical protein